MYHLRSLVLWFTPLTSLFWVSSQRQAHRKHGGAASKLVESSISAQDRKRSAASTEMCDLDLKENLLQQQSWLTAQRQPFWVSYHHHHVWISPDLLEIHECGICLPDDKMQDSSREKLWLERPLTSLGSFLKTAPLFGFSCSENSPQLPFSLSKL